MAIMNNVLRAELASLTPVQPLVSPLRRALALAPMAVLLLVAAPLAFSFRDIASLGWVWSWGASVAQLMIGLVVVAVALNESIPGRALSLRTIVALIVGIAVVFIAITVGSWSASPLSIPQQWWKIAGMCVAVSAASALPAIALSAILIVRAYPVRPGVAGGLAGAGCGLLADAGWRLFCHYSEPEHVLLAHLSAIALAALAGAILAPALARAARQ